METTTNTQVNYSPKQDYLLLAAMEDSGVSRGGIIIPQLARMKLNQGRVLEAGPLVNLDNIKIGEVVIFTQHAEYRIHVDAKEFILIREGDIICGDNLTTPSLSETDEEPKLTSTGRKAPLGLNQFKGEKE